jgi:metal-responsive CopG/Arc/MetJ family transcriptional regulator
VVRLIEDLIEEGLQDVSRFTPGRRRHINPKMAYTRTTVRLDTELLARLDAAVQQLGTTRAALLEAMVEAKWQAPGQGQRQFISLYLDPRTEQSFRHQYVRHHGDIVKSVTDIVHAGLAAIERLAPRPRRRPVRGPNQFRPVVVTLEIELLARLTAAAKAIGTSRAALIEAMIEARLRGEI